MIALGIDAMALGRLWSAFVICTIDGIELVAQKCFSNNYIVFMFLISASPANGDNETILEN